MGPKMNIAMKNAIDFATGADQKIKDTTIINTRFMDKMKNFGSQKHLTMN